MKLSKRNGDYEWRVAISEYEKQRYTNEFPFSAVGLTPLPITINLNKDRYLKCYQLAPDLESCFFHN